MKPSDLEKTTIAFMEGYDAEEIFFKEHKRIFPRRDVIYQLMDEIRCLIFPGYFDDESAAGVSAGAMRHEDIDLSEMVEAATLEFDAIAFERGCLVEDDIAPDLHVSGDPEWIERVVRILVDNACKYAARGSTVTVRLSGSSGHPILAVHNMGSPIDAEDLPHVFERFYRTDEARSREAEGGFGLGLAIAKGIVDAHGGKISVSSTEEEGTTFTVAF